MNIFKTVYKGFMKIKLIDRCLIMFMFLLLAQSIYGLLTGETDSQSTNSIDIVLRTTSAAIFGYFLSANFIKRTSTPNNSSQNQSAAPSVIQNSSEDTPVNTTKNKIGFTPDEIANTIELGNITNISNNTESESETSNQQIIITTIIGLVSLIAILIARNFIPLTSASVATLSHLRDLVSGCVGFLVGCPVSNGNKSAND